MFRLNLNSLLIFPMAFAGCGDTGHACGPEVATVAAVIDGDTIELNSGERVRLLMINTPELSESACWASEAKSFSSQLMQGREVKLTYDVLCKDVYSRLLAYISVDNRDINALLVERGYACTLHIPPNGREQAQRFQQLETIARTERRGMWGACSGLVCD